MEKKADRLLPDFFGYEHFIIYLYVAYFQLV